MTLLDSHEAALIGDRRARDTGALSRIDHVLCDVRDASRLRAEIDRAAPERSFTWRRTSTSTGPNATPRSSWQRTSKGAGTWCRPPGAAGLAAAAALPSPNPAARRAAAEHDVERQAERVEDVLLRAIAGRVSARA